MEINEQSIRKAYFSGKLNKFLDDISAEGIENESDLQLLETLLPELEKEKKENEKKSARHYGEIDPPSADELFAISNEQKEKIKVWLSETKEELRQANTVIKEINSSVKSKRFIAKDEFLAWGFELLSMVGLIDNYIIITEQLYRKRLTDLIDDFGMSRAEAEERARLTEEYKEYKRAVAMKENIIEVEMLCKKWAGI